MGPFEVVLTRRGQRHFEDLPAHVRRRFYAVFDAISLDPFRARPTFDIRTLKGPDGARAVRVGDYRGIFVVSGHTVWFTVFAHRSVVYRR